MYTYHATNYALSHMQMRIVWNKLHASREQSIILTVKFVLAGLHIIKEWTVGLGGGQ